MAEYEVTFEDGTFEEIYKILRQSVVGNQHMTIDELYTYFVYRPAFSDGLPRFIVGSNSVGVTTCVAGDITQTMTEGVIEAPVEGDDIAEGDTVYVAYDATRAIPEYWYLTTDAADGNIVGCYGLIVDNQYPIHYGETLVGDYADLYNVRLVGPACTTIDERQ
jgi:hypothetical protein